MSLKMVEIWFLFLDTRNKGVEDKRFKEFISNTYHQKLTISDTTESTSAASYLYLLFTWAESNNTATKLLYFFNLNPV